MPERTYNAIIADKETYALTTLDVWGWHIILDSNKHLDFKMGNGEKQDTPINTPSSSADEKEFLVARNS